MLPLSDHVEHLAEIDAELLLDALKERWAEVRGDTGLTDDEARQFFPAYLEKLTAELARLAREREVWSHA